MSTHAHTDILEPALDVNETARVLNVPRRQVYLLVQAGELEPTRVGKRLRFLPGDLRQYLERGKAEAAP